MYVSVTSSFYECPTGMMWERGGEAGATYLLSLHSVLQLGTLSSLLGVVAALSVCLELAMQYFLSR